MKLKVYNDINNQELIKDWSLISDYISFPQTSYVWMSNWWDCFKNNSRELYIISVYDDYGKIVGLSPMYIEKKVIIRQLKFIGSGFNDFGEVIIDINADKFNVYKKILSHIKTFKLWDICLLEQINNFSLDYLFLDSLKITKKKLVDCLIINFKSDNWEDFFEKIDKNHRKIIKKKLRKLERNLNFEIHTYHNEFIPDSLVNEIIKIHVKRSSFRNQKSKFNDDIGNSFYKKIIKGSIKLGLAKLFTLTIGGNIVAYSYGFIHKKVFYNWNSSFDVDYYNYSLGNLMDAFVMKENLMKGVKSYNFMRGGYDYKKRWIRLDEVDNRESIQQNYLFIISKDNLIGKIANLYYYKLRDVFKYYYYKFFIK